MSASVRGIGVRTRPSSTTPAWAVPLVLGVVLAFSTACPSKEEVLKKAEESGKFLVERKAEMAKGVGEGLQGSGKEGAESLSQGVGEVIKGTAHGIDKSLSEVKISVAEAVTVDGMKVERGQRRSQGGQDGISLYVISEKAFEGNLMLRAIDRTGKEVGRSRTELKRTAQDAGYVDFMFDERTPLLTVDHFELNKL